MTTFALVHGAWHGAWCWERLVPELEARGHSALMRERGGEWSAEDERQVQRWVGDLRLD